MSRDLFGHETPEGREKVGKRGARRANGYAAPPGTGPDGETCGTCRHMVRRMYSRVYFKCNIMRSHWTGGYATDIKAGAPACRRWEPDCG